MKSVKLCLMIGSVFLLGLPSPSKSAPTDLFLLEASFTWRWIVKSVLDYHKPSWTIINHKPHQDLFYHGAGGIHHCGIHCSIHCSIHCGIHYKPHQDLFYHGAGGIGLGLAGGLLTAGVSYPPLLQIQNTTIYYCCSSFSRQLDLS